MHKDGVTEMSVFRIMQQDGTDKMPQEWWWPLLENFLQNNTANAHDINKLA